MFLDGQDTLFRVRGNAYNRAVMVSRASRATKTRAGRMRILVVFVDGLGLGVRDAERNPVYGGACPLLAELLEGAKRTDATMGVAGLPQSATGQTALLAGINAARLVGRHVEGFPGRTLRAVLRAGNIFTWVTAAGGRAAFANAYWLRDIDLRKRRPSATTVAALAAFGKVRGAGMMMRGRAVYHDITRESLRGRGYRGPLISAAAAARHLTAIAEEHDFTLFEYFLTDRAGHRGGQQAAGRVLGLLDALLGELLPFAGPGRLLVLVSDHGNIEDISTRGHTRNPVPLAAVGEGAERLMGKVEGLPDFVPAVLALWSESGTEHN